MITIEAVRTALLSSDPYTEMDRVVRSELGTGRTTKQITDEFRPIINAALQTPSLSDEAKEAFLSTLDALTGICHPDQCYEDPPNTTLPTEEEIAELPRWAQVAFAARCARRVLGHFTFAFAVVPPDRIQAVDGAISVAEENAEIGALRRMLTQEAVGAAMDVMLVYDEHLPALLSALNSAHAAATANAPQRVACVYVACVQAADAAERTNIRGRIRSDFDHLSRLAEAQHWDDDTPVPPAVFGPLWPEGPPKGWPPITDILPRAELVIEGFAREQAAHQVIVDDVVNLFHALNRYYITRSGERLTLDQFRSLVPALVPAEV